MSTEYIVDDSNPLKLKRAKPQSDDEEVSQSLEEQLLEQDIDGNRRRRKHPKVDTTQYNDDSSDEDYEEREPVNQEKKDDTDSDMFASDDEDENKNEVKTKVKKSKVEFLDVKTFEKDLGLDQKGTGDDEKNQGSEEDDDEEEEEDQHNEDYYNNQEDEHNHKRPPKREPKLDAFNLKEEQSEGRFDIDGNFIRADNSDDEQDNNWLDGIKKKDIKKAKRAQEKRDKLRKEYQSKQENFSVEELLFNLITLLQPVEAPMEALQRLNKSKPKKKSKKVEVTDEEKQKEEERKSAVIKITEYAERLIECGFQDIYELEKEDLILKYKEESGKQYVRPKTLEKDQEHNNEEAETQVSKKWEFRWENDEQIHGPYGSHEMNYWKNNYFQDKVEVREVGQSEFINISKLSTF